MWKNVREKFEGQPGRVAVVRAMAENGLSIDDKAKLHCGPVEVGDLALARACGVDRRTVRATVAAIRADKRLFGIFSGILPAGSMLSKAAPLLGFGVVEIEANAAAVGIVASASGLLARRRISIRQIYAKDPDFFENPTLTIITARPIPGKLLEKFRKIRGVKRVLLS
jgi:hypothetical protein